MPGREENDFVYKINSALSHYDQYGSQHPDTRTPVPGFMIISKLW